MEVLSFVARAMKVTFFCCERAQKEVTNDQTAAFFSSECHAAGVPEFGDGEKMGAMIPVRSCHAGQENGPPAASLVGFSSSSSSSDELQSLLSESMVSAGQFAGLKRERNAPAGMIDGMGGEMSEKLRERGVK